jgi:outer membrane protein OmpA-like peptidoglycan-associated protein
MGCERLSYLVGALALAIAGCGGANTKNVCKPIPSFASPAVQCVAMAEAPPPPKPEPKKPEPEPEPPKPEPEPEPEPPPVVVKKERIELDRTIQFEPYSATLIDDSKALLDEVAAVLNKHPEIKLVQIEGHTDSKLDTRYNQKLSEKRANAVRTYLVAQGIAKSRLVTKGFGETKPIGDNTTWKGRFQNRRVDLKITKRDDDGGSDEEPEKPEKENTEDTEKSEDTEKPEKPEKPKKSKKPKKSDDADAGSGR